MPPAIGGSVVAPTSTIAPLSTWGSRASCCALEYRWISSRKTTVATCSRAAALRASSTTARSVATPSVVELRAANRAPVASARSRPMVVLPLPGGPHRMIDGSRPPSTSRRSGAPGPSRPAWPTTSSRAPGRIRSASGRSPMGGSKRGAGRAPAGRRAMLRRSYAPGRPAGRRGHVAGRGRCGRRCRWTWGDAPRPRCQDAGLGETPGRGTASLERQCRNASSASRGRDPVACSA
jgi:hypothetical protein